MKSVAATLDTDGAVMNFPATEPGNLRERIRLKGLTFELPASFGI